MLRLLLGALMLGCVLSQECGDIFCSSDETCCKDFPGAQSETECCISMVSSCVLPRGPFETSTCCPRWTIGCKVGSVGCCDPARPWQLTSLDGKRAPILRQPNKHRAEAGSRHRVKHVVEDAVAYKTAAEPTSKETVSEPTSRAAALSAFNLTGYALFPSSFRADVMEAIIFDASTGAVHSKRPVVGAFKSYYEGYYGEGTRVLPFDAQRIKYYLAEQSGSSLVVYSIDPLTGDSSMVEVSGCEVGYPVGMAWDPALDALIVGTQTASTALFCAIVPSSGEGKPMGRLARGGSEATSDTFFAAYLSASKNGVALRVGHRQVSAGVQPGKGLTILDPSGGTAVNGSFQQLDFGRYGLPATVQHHPTGGYISLAPRAPIANLGPGYDIIAWDSASVMPTVVANLSNAHAPSIPYTHAPLGYVGDAIAGKMYAAMTVEVSPYAVADRWSVAILDLDTGAVTQSPLSPQPSVLGAETAPLSGFGIAIKAM